MRAALRRVPVDDDDDPDRPEVLEIGDVRLDAGRHEVFVRGSSVALPLKEFELLELLMANAGRVLTRDVLIDRIWGPNYFGDTKTLDVHIKRLRAKLESDSAPHAHRDRARRRLPLRTRGPGLGVSLPAPTGPAHDSPHVGREVVADR